MRSPRLPGDASAIAGSRSLSTWALLKQGDRPGRGTIAQHCPPCGRAFSQPAMQRAGSGVDIVLEFAQHVRVAHAGAHLGGDNGPDRLIGYCVAVAGRVTIAPRCQ